MSLTLNKLPVNWSTILNNCPETPLTENRVVPVAPVAGAFIKAAPVTPSSPVFGLKVRFVWATAELGLDPVAVSIL